MISKLDKSQVQSFARSGQKNIPESRNAAIELIIKLLKALFRLRISVFEIRYSIFLQMK